jgi:hypothetical protein
MILLRKKYLLLHFFLSLLFILIAADSHWVNAQGLDNCPYPPFSASETGRPNILIILDHSASMGSGSGSHWVTAKEVVKEIIDDFPNVRFGLMRMDASSSENYVSGIYPNISIEDLYVR